MSNYDNLLTRLDAKANGYVVPVDLCCEAAVAIRELQAELADVKEVQLPRKLKAVAEGWKQQLAERQDKLAALEATIQKMVEFIGSHGKHLSYCAIHLTEKQNSMGGICNCGLQRLKTETPIEHLSQYRDAVIEKCAQVCNNNRDMTGNYLADRIRIMKGRK